MYINRFQKYQTSSPVLVLILVFVLGMAIVLSGCSSVVHGLVTNDETAPAAASATRSSTGGAGNESNRSNDSLMDGSTGGTGNSDSSSYSGNSGGSGSSGNSGNSGSSGNSDSSGSSSYSGNSGNSGNSGSSGYSNYSSASVIEANSSSSAALFEFEEGDANQDWNTSNSTAITLNGSSVQISGSGAVFSGRTLKIDQAGTYVLSGALDNGQILIEASKEDVVRLILSNVTLHNETGPAIYAPRSKHVIVVIREGTVNTVSDGANYEALESGDDPSAAIYTQHNLSVSGEGTLTVIGNYGQGIRTQDMLTITGGVINITSVGDAIRGRDGVAIQNGLFTLKAGGDGIQSNNANSDDVGFIVITGGTFSIQAQNDGIQAESVLTISGGSFDITTGGGSANAPASTSDSRGGRNDWDDFGGGMRSRGGIQQPPEGFPGARGDRGEMPQPPEGFPDGWGDENSSAQSPYGFPDNIDSWGSATQSSQEGSESRKALKAKKQINIIGGEFTVNAEDDGVHSNGDIFISASKIYIETGDDGIHADGAIEVTGGGIIIPVCYEGIEGLSVTISGGDISITARDDAINAADSSVSSSAMGGRPMGGGGFQANSDIFVRISGGMIDLYGTHDGIDSNGNIFLEGGVLRISGPSQGMEGAIDLDGGFLINGGELITAGSVMSSSSDSTQPLIIVSYSQQQSSGSVIAIKDANGGTLLEYTSKTTYSMSGFTSPSFKAGETYSLYIDGVKRCDITLSGIYTGISDDGSAYNGGRMGGGGRGNWGGGEGGGMPPSDEGNRQERAPRGDRLPPGETTLPDGRLPSDSGASL